jgi:hypothetical protein
MEGFQNALKKRKEMDGSLFDVWAFDQKSEQVRDSAEKQLRGTEWILGKETYRHAVSSSLVLCVSKERYESLMAIHRGTGDFQEDMTLMALRYG